MSVVKLKGMFVLFKETSGEVCVIFPFLKKSDFFLKKAITNGLKIIPIH